MGEVIQTNVLLFRIWISCGRSRQDGGTNCLPPSVELGHSCFQETAGVCWNICCLGPLCKGLGLLGFPANPSPGIFAIYSTPACCLPEPQPGILLKWPSSLLTRLPHLTLFSPLLLSARSTPLRMLTPATVVFQE